MSPSSVLLNLVQVDAAVLARRNVSVICGGWTKFRPVRWRRGEDRAFTEPIRSEISRKALLGSSNDSSHPRHGSSTVLLNVGIRRNYTAQENDG